jgi:hypothetical protein
MILSSTTRKKGQKGCRPFPLHPRSPPSRFRLASRPTISVASLRNAVGFPPESMFTFARIPSERREPHRHLWLNMLVGLNAAT